TSATTHGGIVVVVEVVVVVVFAGGDVVVLHLYRIIELAPRPEQCLPNRQP
ncbi:unnamed protein product, partial [Rotaria magnacalcarata]